MQQDQASSEGSYFALMSPALAGFLGFSFWRGLEMVAAGVLVKGWIRASLGAGLAVFCLVALVRAQFRFRRWRDNPSAPARQPSSAPARQSSDSPARQS